MQDLGYLVSLFTQTVIRALYRHGMDQRGSDPHPRQPAPMLLQKADAMFSSPDWTFEPKWTASESWLAFETGM